MHKFPFRAAVLFLMPSLLWFNALYANVDVKMNVDKQISTQLKSAATPHELDQLDETIQLAQIRQQKFKQLLLDRAIQQQQLSQKIKHMKN